MRAGDEASAIEVRYPQAGDGAAVHRLIARCPPLDPNSTYCNLLQCTHFAATCVLAERGQQVVGFISAYRLPQRPQTLFVWQVAVDPSARHRGLGLRMLSTLLGGSGCNGVTELETTITPDNAASWRLFRALARALNTKLIERPMFDRERHFGGQHASEMLAHIGPFQSAFMKQADVPRRTA